MDNMLFFDHSLLLWLIPCILILWGISLREKMGYKMPNILMRKYRVLPGLLIFIWILRICIVTILCIILAGPQRTVFEQVDQIQKSHLIILDISLSMLADDIAPNRVTAAKDTIHTFLKNNKWDYFWLIIFKSGISLFILIKSSSIYFEKFL